MFSGERPFYVSESYYISPDELYPTLKRPISFGKKMQLIYARYKEVLKVWGVIYKFNRRITFKISSNILIKLWRKVSVNTTVFLFLIRV